MLERALTTGSGGMIGSYVDFGVRMDRSLLDVTDLAMVRAVCQEHKPKVIIHLAAATDLARCEREPDYAYRVNTVGTYTMALAAREVGALLVYVSTSNVFDGTKSEPYTENDLPSPINVYGHSKYLAELAVQSMLSDHLIVRVTWVFGGGPDNDKKFVGKILKQLDQQTISVVGGKRGSPTYGKDVINGIKWLVEKGERGIVNMPNAGVATRVDIAREIVAVTGSHTVIQEADESTFHTPYAIGENDSMSSRVSFMRPWQEALREYIQTEWSDTMRTRS